MANVPLVLLPGLVTDDTKYLRKGSWGYVDKVRFWRGLPQTIGGWESFIGTMLGGVCRKVFAWTDTIGTQLVAFGTHQTLEVAYGGILYDITPAAFVPGAVDGTGGQGYGTGVYSAGEYSEPSVSDYFPLTWSLDAYGQSLMANPRGQTIFWWQNNTATPAAPLTNAPDEVTYMLVNPQRQVMAFGCNEEVSGTFNPLCIRFSDIEDPTDWTTSPSNLAGEVILEGGGRIVAAAKIGPYLNVWTDNALYLGRFTGDYVQPWRFDRMGDHCGLIGPNAFAVTGQKAAWIAPNTQFYGAVMGGEPQMIVSPVQADFADNLSPSQADKIQCSSVSEFDEVWWFYPDSRDGNECSRYVSINANAEWSAGVLARTAFVDAGPIVSPIGVTFEGQIYWHERGCSADGNAFSWEMETADQYLSEADSLVRVSGIWPDFHDQQGPVMMSLTHRLYPQDTSRVKGPFVLQTNKKRKDFRLDCRIMRLKFNAEASPTFARLGKPELDTMETSRR